MSEIDNLFSENGEVDELELDDEFQQHLMSRSWYEKHDVAMSEVLQVHGNLPRYYLNVGKGRRALIIMVGPTYSGRWLCVPLEPTGRWGTWRPVTAFEANTHHKERYREDL